MKRESCLFWCVLESFCQCSLVLLRNSSLKMHKLCAFVQTHSWKLPQIFCENGAGAPPHKSFRISAHFLMPLPMFPCPIWLDDRGTGQWKWMEEVPRRTSLVPLAFPCFVHCLVRVEAEGLLDYQGRAGIISIVRWNLRPVIVGVGPTHVFAQTSGTSQDCPAHKFCMISQTRGSEGRGCLEEGCLGLPGVFPDISWTALFLRTWRKRRQEPELPDLAWNSQTSFFQTSATTREACSVNLPLNCRTGAS